MGMPYNYNNVKNNCKGEKYMRKYYLDNIRWATVVLVVIYCYRQRFLPKNHRGCLTGN